MCQLATIVLIDAFIDRPIGRFIQPSPCACRPPAATYRSTHPIPSYPIQAFLALFHNDDEQPLGGGRGLRGKGAEGGGDSSTSTTVLLDGLAMGAIFGYFTTLKFEGNQVFIQSMMWCGVRGYPSMNRPTRRTIHPSIHPPSIPYIILPQEMELLVDTGSSDLLVASTLCKPCDEVTVSRSAKNDPIRPLLDLEKANGGLPMACMHCMHDGATTGEALSGLFLSAADPVSAFLAKCVVKAARPPHKQASKPPRAFQTDLTTPCSWYLPRAGHPV